MSAPLSGALDWEHVAPYLDRAFDLDKSEREIWLAQLDVEQPAIAYAVRALIAERDALDASEFMARSPFDLKNVIAQSGARIGAYVLDRLIGRGGMGEVWLARRGDGRFEAECAIKFVSGRSMHGSLATRFNREGRLLGRLAHPNIARLLDAGTTESGRPYLVLEYVPGEPIDRYCERQALTIRARLRLFIDVLAAVAHAQEHLIVHRDIKPSNVLVTDTGVVKLLDFGIAKLLEDTDAAGANAMTALTPEYAAPEQLTNSGLTTATDVYALGTLLYVLLTGKHPAAHAMSSQADLVTAILNSEPPRLADSFDVDLDTILVKALKKNPAERYGSAAALAEDVQRYLAHLPINARPDTITYRAHKFVRRNRLAVAAAVLVFISLAGGLAAVNHERVIAQQRFEQLRQLADKVFELDEEIRDLPGSTAARRKLVAASLEYLGGLSADVGGDVGLAATLADAYWRIGRIQGVNVELNLGERAEAERSLAKADDFAAAVLASKPDTDALLRGLQISQDRMILAQEDHRDTDALAHARRAIERIEKLLSGGPISGQARNDALVAYSNAALAHSNMDMHEEAARIIRRQMELAKATETADTAATTRRLIANSLSVLTNALRLQGDLEGALQAIREARNIVDQSDHPSDLARMVFVYSVYLREGLVLGEDGNASLGRPEEALMALQKAFDQTEEIARRDATDSASRTRLAGAGREIGDILRWTDPERAVAVYDASLARLSEIPGSAKTQRTRAELLANSSYALLRLKRVAAARSRVDAARTLLEDMKDLPTASASLNSELFAVLFARAAVTEAEGKTSFAIDEYRDLLNKVSGAAPDPYRDLRAAFKMLRLYRALAAVYARSGDPRQASIFESNRVDLLQAWERKLPGSPVVRQLAETRAP